MNESRFPTRIYCAHPVQKEVNDGTGGRVITAKCGKPMTETSHITKIYSPGATGKFLESIEHGLFCPDGHRAGKR